MPGDGQDPAGEYTTHQMVKESRELDREEAERKTRGQDRPRAATRLWRRERRVMPVSRE